MQHTLSALLALFERCCDCIDWSCACFSGVIVFPARHPLQKHLTVRREGAACYPGIFDRDEE